MGGSAFSVRDGRRADVPGIVALCRLQGWASYADHDVVARVLSAPGVAAVVGELGDRLVGFGYGQSDGVIQAHLSLLVVAEEHRRKGLGASLLRELMARFAATRVDLVTVGATGFYASFPHASMSGFRLYAPEAPAPQANA